MEITTLLSRLSGVRKNGAHGNSWVAKCPGHEDRSPSLSVKYADDGRILMHCFAGCGTDAILAILGLTVNDLFPEPLAKGEPLRPMRAFSAADALRCLDREAVLLTVIASDLAAGKPVDADRCAKAAGRISEVVRFIHGA